MDHVKLVVIAPHKEEKKKQRLRATIGRKRLQLKQLVIKTEMLRVSLDMAKQEYMVKVGSLFLKDSKLDLEIIQLKNILHLMEEGYTAAQAQEKIAKTYYTEQLELEREQEQMQYEEEIYKKRESHQTTLIEDLKKVWKRLIAKFHPDLVQNPEEKQKRDEMMKRINRAYQEGDLDQLIKIEQENLADHEISVDNLEEILLRLMKEIMQQIELYQSHRKSEWYDWMIKIERAKKKNINIFADTERQLLNDIVAKMDLIKELKAQIKDKENTAKS